MKINTVLNEAPQRVAIIFGRFNPPHYGHKAAWETASKFDQWFVGTNKSTIGEKDPLPYEVKIEAMKAVWPEVANHIMTEQSWFTMASRIYERFGPVILVVVTDETDKDWIMPTMVKNNGVEAAHGYYNFPKIVWQKAARISSATDLRGAVAKGDKAAFEKAAGVSADTPVAGSTFYEVVSKYLMPYLQAKAEKERIKAEREAAKAAKAAKAKPKKESVTEVAPPGMEKWIKDRKADFKKRYGDRWEEVLYATAWKRKKNESVEESAEQKFAVTYDIYGSNKEKPLYTKTRTVRAKSEQEAIDTLRKLVGGTNYRVEKQTAEGAFDNASPMTKDSIKQDKIRSLKNLIAIAKEKGRQLRVQELELELKKLEGVTEGFVGRETKDGTWRVFKDGQAVAVAGPFKSREEANAWIQKHNKGVAESDSAEDINKQIEFHKQGQAAAQYKGAMNKKHAARIKELLAKLEELKTKSVNEEKQRLDPKCWDGYKKQGTKMKGDTRVNNCVKESFTPMQIALMEGGHSLDEGWKERAAAAALAGAAALGGGNAQAQNIDLGRVMHGAMGHVGRMSNNPNWNKSVAVDAAQKAMRQTVQQHVQQERAGDQELLRKITDQRDRQAFAMAARDKDYWRQAAINMRDRVDMGKAAASIAYYKEVKREMMSKYLGHAEGVDDKVAGRYDPEEFDAMVSRVGKLAKAGPLKTVWDPVKRVYKNVPVNQNNDSKEKD